jgi:hypothetical protein
MVGPLGAGPIPMLEAVDASNLSPVRHHVQGHDHVHPDFGKISTPHHPADNPAGVDFLNTKQTATQIQFPLNV